MLTLVSPANGEPLHPDGPHALTDGRERWPNIDGIPYLRVGRDELRRRVLDLIDAGEVRTARAELLADQDDFARTPPPPVSELAELADGVEAGRVTLRQALNGLGYGPVADYFALRPSVPTFLSGLGLLSQHGGGLPVVEVACGVGQLVREVARRGRPVAGIDVVYSKLWLARKFVVPAAGLVVADISRPGWMVESDRPTTVLCHDAFYFFREKGKAITHMAVVARGGPVLIGHAHNASWDHNVAGSPQTPAEYSRLFGHHPHLLYDDAEFCRAHLDGVPARPRSADALASIEAISLVWRHGGPSQPDLPDRFAQPIRTTALVPNPLLVVENGKMFPRWPRPNFAEEYKSADYLYADPAPRLEPAVAGASPEVDAMARKRWLLPEEDVI